MLAPQRKPTPGTAVRAEFRGIWTAGGSAARDRLAVENMDLWRPTKLPGGLTHIFSLFYGRLLWLEFWWSNRPFSPYFRRSVLHLKTARGAPPEASALVMSNLGTEAKERSCYLIRYS